MILHRLFPILLMVVVAYGSALPGDAQTPAEGNEHLPAGPERQLVLDACVECHSLERIYSTPRSAEQWKGIVESMVAKGAELNAQSAAAVGAYLAKSFGPANFPAALVTASGISDQKYLRPVANVYQLMKAIIVPSADAIWKVNMDEPEDDEQWSGVRHAAIALAESGNLLMIGNRARDQGNWVKYSQSLIDWSTIILRAAEAKNVPALNEAGDELLTVCANCHRQYKASAPR